MNITEVQAAAARIREALSARVIGQREVINELLIALLSGGHALLVGVPGLAKTMLVRSLAETLGLSFNRIQFTPDLMPADITGTEVLQEDRVSGERQLHFMKGPIFAHLILADEINRTPPKTQAALLEAMQEQQVTAGGHRHALPQPFFVLATQNPIEQEGTYPLPEAQSDRFMLEIRVDYPSEDEELQIARQSRGQSSSTIAAVVSAEELAQLQRAVESVELADHDLKYATSLVRTTRVQGEQTPEYIRKYIRWGAGPRATKFLVLAAQAHAALHGQPRATWHDIQAVVKPVLRHRLLPTFQADADGLTTDDLIDHLLKLVPSPDRQNPAGISRFFESQNKK